MGDEAFSYTTRYPDASHCRRYVESQDSSARTRGAIKKVAVYGAIAKDGRQFFQTYDRYRSRLTECRVSQGDAEAFWKAVAAVVNRASPHRAKLVRKLLRENKNIS